MKKARESLLEHDLDSLKAWMTRLGSPAYRASQVFDWVFRKHVYDFDAMTNLPRTFRSMLQRRFTLLGCREKERLTSSDGSVKYLFELHDGNAVEAVFIPQTSHYSLCISSQVGCALGCKFCATGALGIRRNLSAAEIISQILHILGDQELTHKGTIVFMGMGEPLLNLQNVLKAITALVSEWGLEWSPRRITVSTAGIIPEMYRLGRLNPQLNLAVSLNAADNRTRNRLMPINRKYPLKKLLKALEYYPGISKQHRITFEYIMLRNINDSDDAAARLAKILDRHRSKINLIPFNPVGSRYRPSTEERIQRFREILEGAGFVVKIRKSRGEDIRAACGQLAGGFPIDGTESETAGATE